MVVGNYLGTDISGTIALPNQYGITVKTDGNIIGGTTALDRNVIAGNNTTSASYGVGFWQDADNNTVQGNYIGVGADGVKALGNRDGILFASSQTPDNNVIGGTTTSAANVIANNTQNGVTALSGIGNAFLGNAIYSNTLLGINLGTAGVTANDVGDGDTGANNLQNFPVLTSANSNASGTTIVGSLNSNANTTYRIEFFANRPAVADAANGEGERYLGYTTVTTNGSGNASFNTTLANVWVNSDDRVTATATVDLGGGNYGSTSEFAANVTATSTGIIVVDTTSDVADGTTTSITNLGNSRGADGRISLREAITAANNTANGGAPDKIVFGITATDSGHLYYTDDGVSGQISVANLASTTATYDSWISNIDPNFARSWYSLALTSVLPTVSDALIIDATTQAGFVDSPIVELDGSSAGTANGLNLTAGSTTVRGLVINRFSGPSAGHGINISAGSGNTLQGNTIGADVSGTETRSNNGEGIYVLSGGHQIGGTGPIDGNLISGNNTGIRLNASGSVVQGNLIGTNADGNAVLGNTSNGIWLNGSDINVIGGTTAGAGNVIGGSGGQGVLIFSANNNTVQGNFIGTDTSGTIDLGNGQHGVAVISSASNTTVGGIADGAGNIIAFNTADGVMITGGTGNSVLRNAIYANGDLGIDLGTSGVTANDVGDADTGANNLQNFPLLSGAYVGGSRIEITGSLNTEASQNYRIEFFATSTADPSGHGEGQRYLGYTDVSTGAGGNANFSVILDATVGLGEQITATATDATGNTSEFAQNDTATAGSFLVVDTTSDVVDGSTTSIAALLADLGADGKISFREAILATNATANGATADRIEFNIAGAGVHTIVVNGTSGPNPNGGGYDFLVDPIVIDATTQDGYSGTPLIALDGSTVTGTSGALILRTNNSAIRGFIVTGFDDEGLEIDGSTGFGDNNALEYNWVGITAAGAAAGNADDGILISEDADNNIVRFNVVGASGMDGIVIRNTDSNGNWVYGNTVGLAPDGITIRANARHGVAIYDAGAGNIIGSDGNGVNDAAERNVISGNSGNGVWISNTNGVAIRGNYIGTDSTGTLARGNAGFGIENFDSAGTIIEDNLISGNTQAGISLWGSSTNSVVVTANYIGTNAAGTSGLGNTNDGIRIGGGANNNTIGGDRTAGEGNVISGAVGAQSDAIEILGSGTNNNKIYGNYLGTNLDGSAAIGNGRHGIVVYDGAQGTEIGGIGTGQGNIISGNTTWGIIVDGNGGITTTGTLIVANFIGLNLAGTAALGNTGGGVLLYNGARSTTIGGTTSSRRNVVSGNTGAGIVVDGALTQNNTILGNYVGTDVTGILDRGNTDDGIRIINSATSNTIGGTAAGARNVISGNDGDGIDIVTATGNTVEGNFIGTDMTGTADLGNTGKGVRIASSAANNVVGGTSPAARNVISGNDGDGIRITVGSLNNQVIGNYLGTDVTGTLDLGNTGYGILINSAAVSNTVGGTVAGAGNLISGNQSGGVGISGAGTTGNSFQGNYLGTDLTGTVSLGNTGPGVWIATSAAGNMVGGTAAGAGNLIAFNAGDGVSLPAAGTGNSILANAIHSNADLGIDDNNDGVTANGTGQQDFPVLTSATSGASTTITGTLNSTASRNFRIEFFANATGDPSGYGEGQRYLGFVNVTTDGSGFASFSPTLVTAVTSGELISATATDLTTNTTSEFGLNIVANIAPVLDNSGTMTLTTITEDQTTNGGNTVAAIVASAGGDRITDMDSGAVEGIAITLLTSGNGTWEYSTNGGGSWNAIGAVSNNSALLLRDSDLVRFVPDGNNGTAASFDFRAWDQTTGVFGTKVDASINGGTTAFSLAIETAGITVTSVNDAPVLDPNGTMTLTTITEDQTTNVGDTIAAIIASAGGDRITDVDAGALEGIAIFDLVSSNGTWQYNTGSGWTDVGPVSLASSLLLRESDSLRFVPDGQNADTAFVTFAAWDQTSGTAGTKVDTSVYGGTTAFSDQVETAAISVTAVNDAPVLDPNGFMSLTSITEDETANGGNTVASIIASGGGDRMTDVDAGALEGIAIFDLTSSNGTWQYNTGSGWTDVGSVSANSSLLLRDTDSVRFVPDGQNGDTAFVTFKAWDQTSGAAGTKVDTSVFGGTTAFSSQVEVAVISVTAVNDAPVLDPNGTMTLTTITEDETSNGGNSVASIIASAGGDRITDVDSGAVEGIAITALISGNGTWEYSTTGGGSWIAVGTVANNSALLLRSTDYVRFVPNGQNTTAASFDFRAWDQSSGAFGTKVDVSTNGGTTAFSTASEVASINVTAVNDAPIITSDGGGATATVNVNENDTAVTTVTATDADLPAQTLTYSIAGGADAAFFAIDSNTGALTFLAAPDYEAPADADSDNVYEVTVQVSDGALTDTQAISVTVQPVNDNNPIITSDGGGATASVNVNENDTAVTTATATDADLPVQTLAYSIAGGADAAFFAIDSNTGALMFLAAPDYETPADANGDNVYEVTVQVSDGALTDTQAISVTVQPVNDNNPIITSDGGGATASVNVNENDTAVTTVAATDADLPAQTLTYAIAGGADAAFFAIDSNTGALTFLAAPDYEAPADANGDNVYEVTVQVSDGALTDTQAISVTVQPVNDNNPIITSDGGGATASVNVNENTTVVTTVTATDADLPAQTLTYSIAGGADAAFFAIDSNTGALTFLAAPDYEAPADANGDNVYEVTVEVSDGALTDTQAISVSVQPLNDHNPVITSDGGGATASVNVNENDTAVTTVTATDADLPAQTLSYAIAGGADPAFFAIDVNSGALTFLAPPDYEAPADADSDNVYEVTVQVSDGALTDTQAISVTVQPVNDNNPLITSDGGGATASVNVNENATAVTTVTATDADLPAQTLTYAIAGGADAAFFAIDVNTGALTFLAPPDYEAPADANSDNVYEVTVQVSDGALTDTQAISVSVQPLNDHNPVITSDGGGATATVNVNENDTAVTTVTATDADLPAQTLTYSIAGGPDAAFFAIDSNSGALTFLAAPDYEAPADANSDNVYEVTVQVSDGALTDTQAISVSVQPLNDHNPVITSDGGGATATVNVNENDTAVTTVTATDADLPAQTLTYSVAGGADAAFFAIDVNTGALTFLAAPDYETPVDANGDNVYEVTVQVSDGALTDTQAISVTVQPVNDNNPIITSDGGGATASVNVNENDTAVTTVTAIDADLPVQTLTYAIAGGADAAFFTIDANSGALTFLAAPDYEAPADANGDNVYEVTVQVSDGALTDTQAISVSVQPVNDNNPVITSDGGGATANINVNENTTAVTTVTATDADLPAQTLTYAIAGGADAAFFAIDSNTGALTFLAPPDYEAPADANGDNVYEVTVQVSDGALTDTQAISVTVQPLNDHNPVITSDGGGATAIVNVNENDTAVTTVTATDADLPAQTLVYSIMGGADAAFFAIDGNSGALTFLAPPDYEAPADANSDNVYEVTVQVSDGALTDTQAISVTVQPVNDNNPVITSDGGGATASVNVNENTTAVTTVTATDADLPAQTLTYAIAGGADAAFFTIDVNTGALTFLAAPDYETPADANGDNVYEVTVQVSDGALTDTQAISVTVQPVNDNNPVITSDGGGATAIVNVNENDTSVTTVTATDADLPAQTLTYSIVGGADAAFFAIDSNTGALTFLAAPDYETPADANGDNVYEVTVQVSDGALTDTQAISVTVQPVNDNNPVITSDGGGATASVNVNENATAVTTVTATDADLPVQTLTYSIAGGADAAFFAIDSNTGALTFLAPPDYEAPADANGDNVYEVTVQVSDGALTDTQAISVTVQPVNDNNPIITSDGGGATASVNVNENTTVVTTVTATDADLPAQTLTYSIAGGADAAFFAIDSNTGALTFLAVPDYEAPADANGDNVYEVTVQVSDGP